LLLGGGSGGLTSDVPATETDAANAGAAAGRGDIEAGDTAALLSDPVAAPDPLETVVVPVAWLVPPPLLWPVLSAPSALASLEMPRGSAAGGDDDEGNDEELEEEEAGGGDEVGKSESGKRSVGGAEVLCGCDGAVDESTAALSSGTGSKRRCCSDDDDCCGCCGGGEDCCCCCCCCCCSVFSFGNDSWF